MKVKLSVAWIAFLVLAITWSWAAGAATANDGIKPVVRASAGLPLSFEPAGMPGRYFARSGGYAVSIGATGAYVAVTNPQAGAAPPLQFAFAGADPAASLEALDPLPGITNYYAGRDPKNWRLGVRNFARLRAQNVYPGVDVVYHGDQRRLEFDFVVAPRANARAVSLAFSGADRLYLDAAGNLVAEIAGYPVRIAIPYAYQQAAESVKPVRVEYVLAGKNKARLKIGAYDRDRELVIDPLVSYATYFGGSAGDAVSGMAVDSAGNSYITGTTCSPALPGPGSTNLIQTNVTCNGTTTGPATYVSEINKAGTAVLYTAILSSNHSVAANGITLDAAGNIYIVGTTNSDDGLPSEVNAYQGGDSDAFIAIFDSSFNVVRTAYLGGSGADTGLGIAVDYASPANVIVGGQTCSDDFPQYLGLERKIENCHAFVTKLDNFLDIGQTPIYPGEYTDPILTVPQSGGAYYFSTLLGGHPHTVPNVGDWQADYRYVPGDIITAYTGTTASAEECVMGGYSSITIPAFGQGLYALTSDNTVVWENQGSPTLLIYAYTQANAVAVDSLNDIFAVGKTTSSFFYPNQWNAISGTPHTGPWITKLPKAGGVVYSATFSTDTNDSANAVAIDSEGRAYIAGESSGSLFGASSPYSFQPTAVGGEDAFLLRFRTDGSDIDYLNYLGGTGTDVANGVAVDANFSAYITGGTTSADFPTVDALVNPLSTPPGMPMVALTGLENAFIAKVAPDGSALTFSSYLGGSKTDSASAVAVHQNADTSIDVYMAGTTTSPDFPVYLPLPQGGTYSGNGDGFLAVIPGESLPSTTVSPEKLSFAAQTVGTTSPAQTITLTNSGNAPLVITDIPSTVDDFQIKNSCLPEFNVGASCTITVTYVPSVAGPESGTLTITIVGGTSPQIALSGVGTALAGGTGTGSTTSGGGTTTTTTTPGFSVTAPSTTSVSVAQGNSSNFQLAVTPTGGFTETVALTCSVPSPATCSITPSSLALSGSSALTASVTVSVPAAPTSPQIQPRGANHPPAWPWETMPFCLAGVILVGRRRIWPALLLLALCLAAIGCGKSSSSSSTATLPAGDYTVTVTATYTGASASTTITHTVTLPLQVTTS
jgi:hypothetical protein